ncbi:MAG: hypothetical protein PVG98_10265 [Chromatiales bacterium]
MHRARALLAMLLLAGAAAGDTRAPETVVYTEPLSMTGRGTAAPRPPAIRPFPAVRPAGGIPVQVPPLRMTGLRQP